jgi:hypothetical protein
MVNEYEDPKQTVKRVKKTYVKNNVRHRNYVESLTDKRRTIASVINVVSKSHVLQTVQVRRVCMSVCVRRYAFRFIRRNAHFALRTL